MDLQAEREAVAAAARRLAALGLVLGTAGNVSLRAGDRVVVTATGVVLADADASATSVVTLDGEHVEGLAPTSELDLHLGVHRGHWAQAVVHTHAPMATALACVLEGELPCVHYQLLSLGAPVPIAPYRTFGTPELARETVEALGDRAAVLMANHGTLTVGPDLDTAVANTELLEWGCELFHRASAHGTPRALDADARAAVLEAVAARGYGATREA